MIKKSLKYKKNIKNPLKYNKNHEYLFKTKKNLLFHKKYSEKLHHLRDSNRWGEQKNDYLL